MMRSFSMSMSFGTKDHGIFFTLLYRCLTSSTSKIPRSLLNHHLKPHLTRVRPSRWKFFCQSAGARMPPRYSAECIRYSRCIENAAEVAAHLPTTKTPAGKKTMRSTPFCTSGPPRCRISHNNALDVFIDLTILRYDAFRNAISSLFQYAYILEFSLTASNGYANIRTHPSV